MYKNTPYILLKCCISILFSKSFEQNYKLSEGRLLAIYTLLSTLLNIKYLYLKTEHHLILS